MNDLPRHTLSRIIQKHGRGICDTPKRVEALLRDLSGAHRREINIIIGALEERVPADLLAGGNTVPREVLLARLAARLRDNLAYTAEAARWGVETWAFALGIVSEAELRERAQAEAAERARAEAAEHAQTKAAERGRGGAPSLGQDAELPPAGRNTQPPSQPPRATLPVGARRQPSQAPKASPPPPIVAKPPTASAHRPNTTHPHAPLPLASRQNVAPPPPARDPSRWGSTLRGCLVAVVLLIVITVAAFFIVPAVIMLLKEEQSQPSINDPRIR